MLWIVLLAWLAHWTRVVAQTVPVASAVAPAVLESGLPLLRNFSPDDGAQPQNWAIVQDPRGVLYVGNNLGVLEFDGQSWRLIKVSNQTVVRSLAIDAAGRIYVGAVGEIGFLEADPKGETRYVSLLDQLAPADREFSDVWNTFVTPAGVVFLTDQRRLRWFDGRFEVRQPDSRFHLAYRVDERVFITEPERGIAELLADETRLLPGSERFADDKIYAMLADAATPTTLLVGTRKRGFFRLQGDRVTPWPTQIDAELKRDLLYCATRLPDGRLALGTSQGGLYLLDAEGRLLGQVNKAKGLQDDSVRALYPDREGGLWLALERGLSRVETGSPLSRFDERNGLAGTVYTVSRHQGRLHAGTSLGLYRLEPGPNAGFTRVAGVDAQTWALLSLGDALVVASSAGLYELRDQSAVLLPDSLRSRALLASRATPGRVFVGHEDGLTVHTWESGQWQHVRRISGISDQIRTMNETEDAALWLASYNTGVLRLRFAAARTQAAGSTAADPVVAQLERFGPAEGLPSLSGNYVYPIAGRAHFATSAGIYRFNAQTGRFEPDPDFAGLFDQSRAVFVLSEEPGRGIWVYSENLRSGLQEVGLAVRQADGHYQWDPRPLSALAGFATQTIHRDPDGVVSLGGAAGLFRYDPRQHKDYAQAYAALVRKVSQPGGAVLYAGSGVTPQVKLPYQRNNLRFEYAAPSFDGAGAIQFQVLLEGNDPDWSEWRAESYRDYSNLFEGDYRFRVRAKNLYGTLSSAAVFEFSVLPPWYRTLWAGLGYLLVLGGCGWAGLRWRLRRVMVKQRALQQMIDERTAQLQQAKESAENALADLQAAQAQLVQSEKMASLGQLVAGVAHEVNTPLGVALTASSYLEDTTAAVRNEFTRGALTQRALGDFIQRASESSEMIGLNLRRAAKLVQSFKQVSVDRSSDGRREFGVGEFLNDLLRSLVSLWKHRPVEVNLDCPDEILIDGFPGALGQIIINLIQNSLLHAFAPDQPGRIRISARRHGDNRLLLVYEDDGAGIPAGQIEKVFEPFFTTKRNQGGTGLGLHIAFNLTTQKLGGTIEVESTPGQGTRFKLELPLQAPA